MTFGENIKKSKKRVEFQGAHEREQFFNLISQNEESELNFIKGLSPEEKEILDSLKRIAREKFYKEYLQKTILYGGDLEKNAFKRDNKIMIGGEIDKIIQEIGDKKRKLQSGILIGLVG